MKIYVWGTGRLVGECVGPILSKEQITAFIDSYANYKTFLGIQVIRPEELEEYDVIIVATVHSQDIKKQCIKLKIDLTKVIFMYGNIERKDLNSNYEFVEQVLGKQASELIKNRYQIIKKNQGKSESIAECKFYEGDYVRLKTFELVVKELRKKGLKGAVAEVGVFQGDFARHINYAFPDAKCYLFDTFEGFNEKEALEEINNGNLNNAMTEAYRKTSIDIVMDKMLYKSNIIIKQGYFPESLNGLEEEWKFVSIDVDLEMSIYNAIEYFYPRLMKGGYIFVHDYNSSFRGVEEAVDSYERNLGIELAKVPICDNAGTLIITK